MLKYFKINQILFAKHNGYAFNLFPHNCDLNLERPRNTYFIRHISKFDEFSSAEWFYVIKDKLEDITTYSSKIRNQIKNGLKHCTIKQEYDINKIYNIYKNVNANYNNKVLSFRKFKKHYEYCRQISDFKIHFWLISYQEIPVGYSKVCVSNDQIAFYEEISIIKEFKKIYANYALIHTMNKYYLNQCHFNFVTDGSRNIYHHTQIQDFLIYKFQFRKAFCQLHVKYNFITKFIIIILAPFYNQMNNINRHFYYKIQTLIFQDKISKATNTWKLNNEIY